jgi:hypothetical protein
MFGLIIYGWAYIVSLENCVRMLLIIATFLSYSGVVKSMEVKRHFSAVALFLGWIELFLMSGRLPVLSVQLEMLKTVSLTFLRFMVGYVVFLITFALSFHILFKGSVEPDVFGFFDHLLTSIPKMIIMFSGEFDATNLNFHKFPGTSHVIFSLFVVLVTIILLNLLNGLAVGDTEKIRKNAETLSLVARIRLIAKVEVQSCLPSSKKVTEEIPILHPNKPNTFGPAQLQSILSIINKKRQANNKWESSVGEDKWSVFTEKLAALQLRQEKLEKI